MTLYLYALSKYFSIFFRQAWDLALDLCLRQLPKLLEDESAEFKHSPFFTEQLTAFDVWLKYGAESRMPPEQLPIVLQVLLSQVHRLRALELLGRFLDLGPWAVSLVGSSLSYLHHLSQVSGRQWGSDGASACHTTCSGFGLCKELGHTYWLRFSGNIQMSDLFKIFRIHSQSG